MQSIKMKTGWSLDYYLTEHEFDTGRPYFQLAERHNKKRKYLFVSPILGKHLSIDPTVMEDVGEALAFKLEDEKVFPEAIIGFAETATALGHAVFEKMPSATSYLHTTRETMVHESDFISFEEEHSHAVSQYLYHVSSIDQVEHLVLVDDEITTGQTVVNVVNQLATHLTKLKEVTVLSLLNWQSKEQKKYCQEAIRESRVSLKFLALSEGRFSVNDDTGLDFEEVEGPTLNESGRVEVSWLDVMSVQGENRYVPRKVKLYNGQTYLKNYYLYSGRFGVNREEQEHLHKDVQQLADRLSGMRKSSTSLVLGVGEWMYFPSRVASLMGEGISFKATTRSPIRDLNVESYPIKSTKRLLNLENLEKEHYIYNLEQEKWEEIFLFVESVLDKEYIEQMIQQLIYPGLKYVTIVYGGESSCS